MPQRGGLPGGRSQLLENWKKSVEGRRKSKYKGPQAGMRVWGPGKVGGCECRDREQDKLREEGWAGAGRTSNHGAVGFHSDAEGGHQCVLSWSWTEARVSRTLK